MTKAKKWRETFLSKEDPYPLVAERSADIVVGNQVQRRAEELKVL